MRQIKVELEKDYTKCPRKENNYWMGEERKWKNEYKKGKKRYAWTKRDAYLEPCEECGKELTIFDDYHRRWGTCNETCYLHLVGMSWSDFI